MIPPILFNARAQSLFFSILALIVDPAGRKRKHYRCIHFRLRLSGWGFFMANFAIPHL